MMTAKKDKATATPAHGVLSNVRYLLGRAFAYERQVLVGVAAALVAAVL